MSWRKHRVRKSHSNFMPRSREQRWSSGESTFLPPMWPGFKSRCRRHLWLSLSLALSFLRQVFTRFSGFPLQSKTNPSKFQFHLDCMGTFKRVHISWVKFTIKLVTRYERYLVSFYRGNSKFFLFYHKFFRQFSY